jgi:hypothetical protein
MVAGDVRPAPPVVPRRELVAVGAAHLQARAEVSAGDDDAPPPACPATVAGHAFEREGVVVLEREDAGVGLCRVALGVGGLDDAVLGRLVLEEAEVGERVVEVVPELAERLLVGQLGILRRLGVVRTSPASSSCWAAK